MIETAEHYELAQDDPEFAMSKGDVLACVPYDGDPDKLTVCFRVSDGYDPECNVYREQVRRVTGQTAVQVRNVPPYGFERADDGGA